MEEKKRVESGGRGKERKKRKSRYYKGRRCLGNDMTRLSCTLRSMICIQQMGMPNLSGKVQACIL